MSPLILRCLGSAMQALLAYSTSAGEVAPKTGNLETQHLSEHACLFITEVAL